MKHLLCTKPGMRSSECKSKVTGETEHGKKTDSTSSLFPTLSLTKFPTLSLTKNVNMWLQLL